MPRAGGERPGQVQAPYRVPPGSTEIILVRHGAAQDLSYGELSPPVDRRDDPPLSPLGLAQAEAVADRLEHEPFARLFVTPLMRTAMTVAPLAARTGHVCEVVPELIEVYLGEWDGREYRRRAAAADELIRRVHHEERWELLPGAEPATEVAARVERGLADVARRTGPDAAAVVVVHGGIVAELCRIVTGSRPFAFLNVDNASMTRLVLGPDGRWLLRSFNEIAHLAGVVVPTR